MNKETLLALIQYADEDALQKGILYELLQVMDPTDIVLESIRARERRHKRREDDLYRAVENAGNTMSFLAKLEMSQGYRDFYYGMPNLAPILKARHPKGSCEGDSVAGQKLMQLLVDAIKKEGRSPDWEEHMGLTEFMDAVMENYGETPAYDFENSSS